MDDVSPAVTYAVLEFADAARSWGVASFAYSVRGQEKALKRSAIAELKIHDLTGSVDILLPLLQHDDPAVRLCAAIPLLSEHRDKAVAALRILDETAELEISFGAGAQLEMIGEPNLATGPDGPVGRDEVPTLAERHARLRDEVRESGAKT